MLMRKHRAKLPIILLLTIGVIWWFATADDRRVAECREAGIAESDRLTRCAESHSGRDLVLEDVKEERIETLRGRFRQSMIEHLAHLRTEKRAVVDPRN